jgi:nitrogen regulatory protein PII-like uncharacterized protein
VLADASGNVTLLTENHLFGEDKGVLNEDSTFLLAGEVVEEVIVEHSKLRSLAAVDEGLTLAPGDGTDVAILTERLLQVDAVVVHVFHDAGALEAVVNLLKEIVAGKLETGLHALLNSFKGDSLNEPTGLKTIDDSERVIELLEEVSSERLVLGEVLQSAGEDSAVAAKVTQRGGGSTLVDLFNGQL